MTLDEGYSYKILLGNQVIGNTANNHFLNTFLMAVCYRLFGMSELSLRLPNVLGFLMYGFACFQLLKNKPFFILLPGIILLLLNPYLIDFFSLARGYGLAIGFFMVSLLYLFKATMAGTIDEFLKHTPIALLFSAGACFSNLTYINANLIIFFILFISFLKLRKQTVKSRKAISGVLIAIAANIISMGWLIRKLIQLRNAGELYHGGTNGFWQDTLKELISSSVFSGLHNYNLVLFPVLSWFITILFFIMLGYALLTRKYDELFVAIMFLSLMIAAPVCQFLLLQTPLPFGRTSLIYIPLTGISIFFFWKRSGEKIIKYTFLYFIRIALFLLLLIAGTYNFAANMNPSYCYDWSYNRYTKDAMELTNKIYSGGDKLSIMYTVFLESGISYYKQLYSMDFLTLAGDNKIITDEDLLLLLPSEKEKLTNLDEYTLLKNYNNGECFLYAKKSREHDKKEMDRHDIYLQAANGLYMNCNWDHHLYATSTRPSVWETFSFIIYANNECAIKSYEGFYTCPELMAQTELTATRHERGEWELYHYSDLGNGYYAFKASNNKFLSFDTGTKQFYANGNTIGPNEKFKLTYKP